MLSTILKAPKMSDEEGDFAWTCGNDESISHRRHIANGGFSEVHEMIDNATGIAFARKLIHATHSKRLEIQREVRIMFEMLNVGGPTAPNIVTILKHGQLRLPKRYFFIDMELGSFTLETYISSYCDSTDQTIDWATLYNLSPVVIQRNSSPIAKLQNWCTIGTHIASGLKYMHSHRYVHRDLKPANALTNGITTIWSRGIPCYRAPELYKDTAKVTAKVDIWALGCILYQCITGSKAFASDFEVASYSEDNVPAISMPWHSEIWHDLLSATIHHLLHKDESQRPTADNILDLFTSFKRILVDPLAEPIFNCAAHLCYEEWTMLCVRCPDEIEWLYEFAKGYKIQGEASVVNALLEEMVLQYLNTIQRLHETNRMRNNLSMQAVAFIEDPNLDRTRSLFEKCLNSIPERSLAWICYEIAIYLTSGLENDWEGAISICKQGTNKSPKNTILPMLLSNLYAASGRYHDAIETEDRFVREYNGNDVINLESALFSFYACVFPLNIKDITTLIYSIRNSTCKRRVYIWMTWFHVNVRFQPRNDRNPLYAAWTGDSKSLTIQNRSRPDMNDGITALHLAVRNGHVDIIKVLKEMEVDVSAKTKSGWTPMHHAAWTGHIDVIKLLKDIGADVSLRNELGSTPMHNAAENGHAEAIKSLKEMGAEASEKDKGGRTPMHIASQHGHVDAIKVLKEMGAEVSVKDEDGRTPIHIAAQYGDVDAIKVLKDMGADVSAMDEGGWAPIHIASQHAHIDAINMLRELGADVSVKDKGGRTPMHCAAQDGHVEAIKALKEMGADVSVKDKGGQTPMHCAAQNGYVDVINVLKEMGVYISVKDKEGRTPIHIASQHGHVDAIKALQEMGTDASVKGNGGRTPILQHGHIDAIEMLKNEAGWRYGVPYGVSRPRHDARRQRPGEEWIRGPDGNFYPPDYVNHPPPRRQQSRLNYWE